MPLISKISDNYFSKQILSSEIVTPSIEYLQQQINNLSNNINSISNGKIFKNKIINGDFNIWQRGTSFTFPTNSYSYTADRLFTQNKSDGQFTISKSTLNSMNSAKITVDTPPTNLTLGNYWYGFNYRFEGQHLYPLIVNNKDITISFIFKSNVTGEYSIGLRNTTYFGQTGIWDDTQADSYVTSFQYTLADTPQKVEVTIPLSNSWTSQPVNDNKLGFDLTIGFLNQGNYIASVTETWLNASNSLVTSTSVNWAANVGNYIELTMLQVEEGNTATEFEQLPFEIQLLRCQRYYEKSYNIDVPPGTLTPQGAHWTQAYNPATFHNPIVRFQVEKRTIPTITLYSDRSGTKGVIANRDTASDVSVIFGGEVGTKQLLIWSNTSVLIPGNDYSFHWTADAEL